LSLIHTADWHLGKRFPSFPEEAQQKLSRARLDAVDRILDLAVRSRADAVLCAGDLFDDPHPPAEWWQGLAERMRRHDATKMPPVYLVPGNHDALIPGSVWEASHPLRQLLPQWAHVVDRDAYTVNLKEDTVLCASPCRNTSGAIDLAMALPAREPGDRRIRVACVHGSTFDIPGYEMNFPIQRDAVAQRGFDYLAIGDTHAFRDVTPELAPTVYPSAPEPTAFDERDVGFVAMVALFPHGRRVRVERERVAYWNWREVSVRSLTELTGLLTERDLDTTVLRLRLDFTVTIAEYLEVQRILGLLGGTMVNAPAVGVLVADKSSLVLSVTVPEDFEETLPPVLKDAVARLRANASDADTEVAKAAAGRALTHLYQTLQRVDRPGET
jgi:DNA repair exonuclease SbcCD nuclease subunit